MSGCPMMTGDQCWDFSPSECLITKALLRCVGNVLQFDTGPVSKRQRLAILKGERRIDMHTLSRDLNYRLLGFSYFQDWEEVFREASDMLPCYGQPTIWRAESKAHFIWHTEAQRPFVDVISSEFDAVRSFDSWGFDILKDQKHSKTKMVSLSGEKLHQAEHPIAGANWKWQDVLAEKSGGHLVF